jgi:hypothetical protein
MDSLSELLRQLHDIESLDAISPWPLAIGWYFIIALIAALLCVIVTLAFYGIAYRRSWQNSAFKQLAMLEKNLSAANSQETVTALSAFLRRIALKRCPRAECAGLVGKSWLQWLQKNASHFDWENKGTCLLEIPYAPAGSTLPIADVQELIKATRTWIKK